MVSKRGWLFATAIVSVCMTCAMIYLCNGKSYPDQVVRSTPVPIEEIVFAPVSPAPHPTTAPFVFDTDTGISSVPALVVRIISEQK